MPFNLKQVWTEKDVADLLGSVQDDRHWRMVILNTGDVVMRPASNVDVDSSEIHGAIETWVHGNDYVGPAAAKSKTWPRIVAGILKENWPELKGDKHIDT